MTSPRDSLKKRVMRTLEELLEGPVAGRASGGHRPGAADPLTKQLLCHMSYAGVLSEH
jgi:hypothetical protein